MACATKELRPATPYDFSTHLRLFSLPGQPTPIMYDEGSSSMRYLLRVRGRLVPVKALFAGEPWSPRIRVTTCSGRVDEVVDVFAEVVRAGFDWRDFLGALEPYPVLRELAERYPGVRPGRCLWLYEALVDTVVEQRIALRAALRIKARLVKALGPRQVVGGEEYYGFPEPGAVVDAGTEFLRGLGLTRAKARAMYEIALAEVEGRLPSIREAERDPWGTAESLTELYGVGSWTAELAVAKTHPLFPIGPRQDLAVRRGLETLLKVPPEEAVEVISSLRDYAGLVMYLAALDYETRKRVRGRSP